MYEEAPMYSSSLSSRGFGQADTPSAKDHPSDVRKGLSEADKMNRAERAAMWCAVINSLRSSVSCTRLGQCQSFLTVPAGDTTGGR